MSADGWPHTASHRRWATRHSRTSRRAPSPTSTLPLRTACGRISTAMSRSSCQRSTSTRTSSRSSPPQQRSRAGGCHRFAPARNRRPDMGPRRAGNSTRSTRHHIAAQWHRSLDDGRRAVELGLDIRIVKGHWADGLGGSIDPTSAFLEVAERLSGSAGCVAAATHDERLLRETLRRLAQSGTRSEVELFLGMPFPGPAGIARAFGVPVRL